VARILIEGMKMATYKNYSDEFDSEDKDSQDKKACFLFVIWLLSMGVLLALSPRQNVMVDDANAESLKKPYILLD